ncbi:hypothetical protein [Urbifossiella limnaea]|uniref:Uncharacterized protein n=1 Tax=Urbifossiella limnaea TaxID=2528023 RepID=A0A517XUI2_9BACT|nr:hypothetical protein [Urbifossiella limnaea]QDU21150.1 hypothetical protein ETAA1_31150 [Urbifossiella limnaea]
MTTLVLGLALSTPAQPPVVVVGRPVVAPHLRPLPPVVVARPIVVPPPVVVARPVVVVPPPVVEAPPPVAALTLEQFSRVFAPTPGRHHYWIIHPRTCQPVEVCFVLPNCGRLDRVRVNRDSIHIDIDNPDYDVDVDFRHDGSVRVRYSD